MFLEILPHCRLVLLGHSNENVVSMPKPTVCGAVAILFVCLVGCGSRQPLRVTGIQLGRSLNADRTIADHTSSFAPSDSIYVSVATAGFGSGTISVRWMYGGRLLDEPKKQVSYRDIAATDFSLQSPAGFPLGEYSVQVFLDGQQVGNRTFRVEVR